MMPAATRQHAVKSTGVRPIARRSLHQAVFVAAGVYNIAWGLTTALYPQWLYRMTGGATPDRAEVASALGLVIGLYGVLYLEVARVPERGALIAAVGLAGKILGPIGLIVLIAKGTWPASSLLISATNDLIWWIPFALYLHDCWQASDTSIRDVVMNRIWIR
jgi:hypothetical protein